MRMIWRSPLSLLRLCRVQDAIPVDVHALACRLGFAIAPEFRLSQAVDGAIIPARKLIIVNARTAWVRQRFTVAHELGEFFLADRGMAPVLALTSCLLARNSHHHQCNRWAAELLIPGHLLARMARPYNPGRLARIFLVSEECMRHRCEIECKRREQE